MDMPSTAQNHSDNSPLISVIVPVYNESGNVRPMCDALRQMADGTVGFAWEFLFVDDGSSDDTFALLCEANTVDPRVKIIQLSRNYGGAIADSAGLQFADGDAAVVIAGDLQDHPREIPRLLERWREGFHVVWAVRAARDDPAADRFFSRVFAATIRRIALPNFPASGSGGFCLLDRIVVDALNAFPERNRSITTLALFTGFRQTQIAYQRQRREVGRSKWSFQRKLRAAVDIIVSFSMLPIRIGSLVGIIIAALTFLFMAVQIINRILYGTLVPGLTQLSVLVLLLGGLQLMMLGVLGEYLWRTLDDARRRPLFLVQQLRGEFSAYRPPLPPLPHARASRSYEHREAVRPSSEVKQTPQP
ncbi:MAG TPA: glycosyltransferase family 2 protein [Stellaceae bacterium]|nr:glycosyltransferase family 2 protein [Stellaceae bacterium]